VAIPSLRTLAALVLGLLLALPAVPALAGQDAPPKEGGAPSGPPKPEGGKETPPVPEKTPEQIRLEEIKAFLKQYEDQLSKMTDADAIAGVDKLKAWFLDAKTPDEGKKSIVKFFSTKVVRQHKDAYLEAAAKALGDMPGDDSVQLLKFLVNNALESKVVVSSVARAGLTGLGKHASAKPGDVKFLTDLLKGKDEFIGAVATALAGYAKAPGAIRKDIFEELLKCSEGTFSKSEANDNNAKRSWNIWGSEVVDGMKKLSRQSFEKPPEFRKWFNNKNEGGGKNPRTWADPPPDAGGGGK
jgi:hypothetical protein